MDIYTKLEKCIKSKKDPDLILSRENDYMLLYHLSPVRRNIIDWYEFPEGKTVLELGAGTGIITEYLLDRWLNVTAFEPDVRKMHILQSRIQKTFGSIPNRFRSLGKAEECQQADKNGYDIVLMIDTFSPEYLDIAAQCMNQGSTLIIATEKKYAEPVWSIKREELTYTFENIEKLLSEKGLKISDTFYPVPDHILPMEIRSEDTAESAGYLILAGRES
jgi:precorrin-6B methylase 2